MLGLWQSHTAEGRYVSFLLLLSLIITNSALNITNPLSQLEVTIPKQVPWSYNSGFSGSALLPGDVAGNSFLPPIALRATCSPGSWPLPPFLMPAVAGQVFLTHVTVTQTLLLSLLTFQDPVIPRGNHLGDAG